MSAESSAAGDALDVQQALTEFADLNRRRLFGSPPLDVPEVERWLELRTRLEEHFGSRGPDDWTGLERRNYLRLPTHIRIEYFHGETGERATVRDVSQGGLFLVTDRPLEKGSRVRLALRAAPDEAPVEVEGVVAWIRGEDRGGAPGGMGIAFGRLGEAQRQLVSRLVQAASGAGS